MTPSEIVEELEAFKRSKLPRDELYAKANRIYGTTYDVERMLKSDVDTLVYADHRGTDGYVLTAKQDWMQRSERKQYTKKMGRPANPQTKSTHYAVTLTNKDNRRTYAQMCASIDKIVRFTGVDEVIGYFELSPTNKLLHWHGKVRFMPGHYIDYAKFIKFNDGDIVDFGHKSPTGKNRPLNGLELVKWNNYQKKDFNHPDTLAYLEPQGAYTTKYP